MRALLYLFLVLILFSCGEKNSCKNEDIEIESIKANDNINIDSQFVFRDIKNLNFIDSLYHDFDNLYLNESKKQKFVKLTNDQKVKLLSPFFKNISVDWIKSDLDAFIIAKQPLISNFQPTIIKVYGTDFAAVILVNLQNDYKIVSGLPIYSIENSGPEISEDTIIITRPKVKCSFKKNVIQLYKLTGTWYPERGKTFIIDSITSELTIHNSGLIKSKVLDSTRFKKKSELDYFQSY